MLRRRILGKLTRLVADNRGEDLAEYALLITLISLVLILALVAFAAKITAIYNSMAASI